MWVSACVGLASLAVAASDCVRLHGRCLWASRPPRVLFLGLIDISRGTWWRSLMIGAHSFFSLAARGMLYAMLSLTMSVAFFNARQADLETLPPWALQGITVLGTITSMAFNTLLLSGMRSWAMIPSGIVNAFVNIPWAAGPPGASFARQVWPSCVFQALYGSITIMLTVLMRDPTLYVSPCAAKQGAAQVEGRGVAYMNWIGPMGVGAWGGWGLERLSAVLIPAATVLTELFLFCTLNFIVWRERRQRDRLGIGDGGGSRGCDGAGSAAATAPAVAYRFMWFKKPYVLCSVRVDPLLGIPVSWPEADTS
jgi:hypothetical protein